MGTTIHRVLGKYLYCLSDQSGPDQDIAAIEKRKCNHLIAKSCRFQCGLDAFAGVGVSARYWSICTKELFLVEKRRPALRLLRKNLPSIARRNCRVHLVSDSAESYLEEALLSNRRFDLVDLDPFGTCYELYPLVAQLVPRGVVCITSGEIFQVYRGLNRAHGRPPAARFRGHKVSQWVVESLLPELLKVYTGAKLVHFYAYPSSVRVILTLGGFPLPAHTFNQRPRFLGWLRSADASGAQCSDIQQNAD